MSFFVYMLKSIGLNSVTYVGYTNNLKRESPYIIKTGALNSLEEENGN